MGKAPASRGEFKPAPKPQEPKQVIIKLPRNYTAVEGGYIIKERR